MFTCAKGHTSKPNEKMNKVVVETRTRQYFEDRDGEEGFLVGQGWEVVKEIKLCTQHYAEIEPSSAS